MPTRASLKVGTEDYLMGICDLTGELARKAVALTVKREFKSVLKIKKLIEEAYGEFLKFNLRNSHVRFINNEQIIIWEVIHQSPRW